MKRSLIVLCAAALLATLPLARVSVAAKPDKDDKADKPDKDNPGKALGHDKEKKDKKEK